MEYALWLEPVNIYEASIMFVLILVLMEYALWLLFNFVDAKIKEMS